MSGPDRGALGRGLDRIVGTVAPSVVDAVDLDSVLEKVDLDELMTRIDIDALLEGVDLDALLQRIDIGGIVARVDVDALIQQVDVDALIRRVDLNALLETVDLNRLLVAIDLNALLAKVDLNLLLGSLDLNRVLAEVDLDLLLAKVDLNALLVDVDVKALAERAQIGELVAQSSQQVAGSILDLGRRQAVGVDVLVARASTRVGRGPAQPGPPALAAGDDDRGAEGRRTVSGQYSGPVTRLAGFALDGVVVTTSFAAVAAVAGFVVDLFVTRDVDPADARGIWWTLGFVAWAFTYSVVSLVVAGRTPGMALSGLRVVRRDGSPIGPGNAVVRTVAFPFSFAFFGLGFIGLFIGGERRAFHDVVASTVVVYDWRERRAEMPAPLSRFLDARAAEPPPRTLTSSPTAPGS